MYEQSEKNWHAFNKTDVFKEMNSSESGLSGNEIRQRIKFFGPNALEMRASESISSIFLRQLHNPIVYVLFLSTFLAIILGKFTDGVVILSVVVLNTLIGFIQEYRAYKTIRALSSMVPEKATVIREGKTKWVYSSQLVPGDVVVLEAGDRIAADLRLFSVKNLECDESTLTGESIPVSKRIEPISPDTVLAERSCMAYNGTYVTSGIGLGIVIATGAKTEFGKLSKLVEQVSSLETPMSITIQKIARWITFGVLVVGLGLFLIGYVRGNSLYDASFSAITLAVAAIPEGLPAIITIAFAIGVRRMARRQAIIRQLPVVETLGSVTVICTDKTGTLTYNEMTVQKIWTESGFSLVSGGGYSFEGQFYPLNHIADEEITEILTAAILCNDAKFDYGPNGLVPIGDPTEIALIVAGRKKGIIEEELRKVWQRKDIIPFEPEKRLMATLNVDTMNQQCVFIKGAPEKVIALCRNLSDVDVIQMHIQSMAQEGMRLLAIAKKEVCKSVLEIDEEDLKGSFTLLGLIGMIDPPRKEVYQALKSCREAGIIVKMVTGDHPLTAEAIARDLGILGNGKVITGNTINGLDDTEWREIAESTQVFARVDPKHKLKLVEVLQELDHIVAMTGDGVNDAAALKKANIGIAMGIKGTAIAKEAADMILADDNFASIEAAVEEGRRVYENLNKSLAFVLPTSLALAFVIFFAVLFFPIHEGILLHPMSPVQILWVNLVVAVALSLPLAFESADLNIMKRPPRKKKTLILTRFLLMKTLIVSFIMAIGTIGFFIWEYQREISKGTLESIALSEAQTMAVTTIIIFQIIYLFNCRSLNHSITRSYFFSNRYLFIGVAAVFIAQAAFIYAPFMNSLYGSSSLDLESWLNLFLVTSLTIPVIWMNLTPKNKSDSN